MNIFSDFRYSRPDDESLLKNIRDLISRFSVEVERAGSEYRTIQIANFAYEMAKTFNNFYSHCPVLSEMEPVRSTRLNLVMATRQVLKNNLTLLGITAPEAM